MLLLSIKEVHGNKAIRFRKKKYIPHIFNINLTIINTYIDSPDNDFNWNFNHIQIYLPKKERK